MNLYQSPRKAETGLGSDRLLQEFTPAEIRSSVVEAGRGYWTFGSGSPKYSTAIFFPLSESSNLLLTHVPQI